MAQLKNEFKKFMDDIEKNIENPKDLEYIKSRTSEFLTVVLEEMESMINNKEEKLDKLEKVQQELENKMDKMQEIMSNIEKDIYSDEGFDFEIVCPYCNNSFVVDIDDENSEIECPECHNIIELDWTGDIDGEGGCKGGCSHCDGCPDDDDDM